jgi:hypothetical protein
MPDSPPLYGIAAEFEGQDGLLAAAEAMRKRGFGVVDTYSSLPIPGMDQALGLRGPVLGWIAAGGAVAGFAATFAMIEYATRIGYPIDIAGRTVVAWPLYIVPSFAMAMLVGAVLVVAAMLFLDRLPRLNHPVFNIEGIEGASQDRLFLTIEARATAFDTEAVQQALADLPIRPLHIQVVPR